MASQLIHNLDLSMSIHNLGLVEIMFGFWACTLEDILEPREFRTWNPDELILLDIMKSGQNQFIRTS